MCRKRDFELEFYKWEWLAVFQESGHAIGDFGDDVERLHFLPAECCFALIIELIFEFADELPVAVQQVEDVGIQAVLRDDRIVTFRLLVDLVEQQAERPLLHPVELFGLCLGQYRREMDRFSIIAFFQCSKMLEKLSFLFSIGIEEIMEGRVEIQISLQELVAIEQQAIVRQALNAVTSHLSPLVDLHHL